MSIRAHLTILGTLLYLIAPMVNGAFAMDSAQTGPTEPHEKAERTRLKQKANDLAVQAFALYNQLKYEPALELLKQAETVLLQLYPPILSPRAIPIWSSC